MNKLIKQTHIHHNNHNDTDNNHNDTDNNDNDNNNNDNT